MWGEERGGGKKEEEKSRRENGKVLITRFSKSRASPSRLRDLSERNVPSHRGETSLFHVMGPGG